MTRVSAKLRRQPEAEAAKQEEDAGLQKQNTELVELSEALDAALNVAAIRGMAAQVASMLACADRTCNADVEEAAGRAEARAARYAHAQAMYDMARALREAKD